MKVKILYLILLSLMSNNLFSQNFNEKNSKKLESFEINLNKFNLDDKEIFNDFSSILELDKKKRKNKTLGIVLISFSLVTSTLGIIELSGGKGEISDSIGGTFLGAGIISGGVSIPLFNSSRKKKKKRDRLVKKYKMTSNI